MPVCPECGEALPDEVRFCPHDGAQLLAGPEGDPLIGTMIGSYRVAGVIGAGGMGRVYLGLHPAIGSRVAIKVLSHDCAQRAESVARFFAEARAVNRIRHEGIVNVLDLAALPDGRPYMIMELLDGEPLAALLARRGRLPPDEVLWLARALLTVLAAAHARGVVHRDLKPANIFMTRGGRVVVLDFGIAKLFPERPDGSVSPATRDGAVLGTPSYMSPEQIQGRPPTAATDLYALGIILYQALGGQLPFDANNLFELLQKHMSAAPPPLRAIAPEVSPALEAAVMRALAKAPEARYASAAEMAATLDAAASSASVRPGGAGPAGRRSHPAPSRPPSQPRSRAPLWIAASALLAGAAALTVWAATRTPSTADPATRAAAAEPPSAADDAATPHAAPTPTAAPTATPTDAGSPSGPAPEPRAAPSQQPHHAQAPSPTARQPHSARPPHAHAATPPAGTPPPATPPTTASTDDPAVTHTGGVTFIDTAALARQKTGLHVINTTPPAHVDPVAYLATARGLARRLMPDARLTEISVDHALLDGTALLRADDGVDYTFRSPSHSHRPADVPANVDVDIPCLVRVWVRRGKVQASPVTDETCHQAFVPAPRCTTASIWRMAFPKGPPPKNLAAEIDYDHGGWSFSLSGAGQDVSTSLSDTCR